MAGIFNLLLEATADVFRNVEYFIKNNLMNFAKVLSFILPFGMYFIGRYTDSIWLGVCVLVTCIIIIYYFKSIANKLGKGITIPIPDERFTEVDDDGEVSIKHERLQELLLYTADLEDWLERKGLV